MKVLMVCLGNICRSPLAEGILKHKVRQNGLDWQVDSAGTGYWHVGEAPDPRSVEVADRHGIDISGQRARQFEAADLDRYDLVLAMDSSNYRSILLKAATPEQEKKVHLIMNFLEPGRNVNVPDPYYGAGDGFENVYQMLDKACDKIVAKSWS